MRPITRTKTFLLADGKTEALTVYERTHYKDPTDRTHDVTFPSRRVEATTGEELRQYSQAWAEASAWIEERQRPQEVCYCGLVYPKNDRCTKCGAIDCGNCSRCCPGPQKCACGAPSQPDGVCYDCAQRS